MISLRDYQQEAVEEILKDYSSGHGRLLVHLPTGSGKTIVMAALAKELGKRTLVIAHREELISQAEEKFRIFWEEAMIGICMAERNEIDSDIIIGSVQSCSRDRRLAELQKQNIELLLIDEAHHAASDSYQKIIEALGFADGSDKLLVGVTATPMRADKKGLGNVFEKLSYSRSVSTMVRAGHLSPIMGRKIVTNVSLDKIRVRDGDFVINELAMVVNTPERNDVVASKYKEHADDRKGVAFCADVQHCKDMAEALKANGIKAEAVWGNMEHSARKQVLEDLKNGVIQVVTSCGILTEGFDEPSISCIAMARPTKSKGLYIQCIGRGLRLYPGKSNCLVLDFSDSGLNLESIVSLSKAIPDATHVHDENRTRETTEAANESVDVEVESDVEFDILGGARFIWIPVGDDEWSLLDDERNEIVISPTDNGYTAKIFWSDGSTMDIANKPLPLTYCSGICEDFARRFLNIAFSDPKAPWLNRNTPPTEGQSKALEKFRIPVEGLNKYTAFCEIKRAISVRNKAKRGMSSEPPTEKQTYFLQANGIDPSGMSKFQAMLKIGEIKSGSSIAR